jgi:hypothetical protein
MGHSSIQVTVDIYGHLIPGADVSFVDRLDEAPEAKKRNENLETSAQESASPAQVTPNEETVIPWQVIDLIGGGAWTRTTDLRIMSALFTAFSSLALWPPAMPAPDRTLRRADAGRQRLRCGSCPSA